MMRAPSMFGHPAWLVLAVATGAAQNDRKRNTASRARRMDITTDQAGDETRPGPVAVTVLGPRGPRAPGLLTVALAAIRARRPPGGSGPGRGTVELGRPPALSSAGVGGASRPGQRGGVGRRPWWAP